MAKNTDKLLSFNELAVAFELHRSKYTHLHELSPLSEATLRYYQQQGLFEPAGRSGKEARYTEEALWRIIFTRLVQLQAGNRVTLADIAQILDRTLLADPNTRDVVKQVATGKEKLALGNLTRSTGRNFSLHPDITLEVRGELTKEQIKQVEMIAKLLTSIVN